MIFVKCSVRVGKARPKRMPVDLISNQCKKFMSKAIASIVIAFGLLVPAASFAATPVQCDPQTNHQIFETGTGIVVGCISNVAWDASVALAKRNTFHFATGASITLKSGAVETCPWWFPFLAGCVINPDLVR